MAEKRRFVGFKTWGGGLYLVDPAAVTEISVTSARQVYIVCGDEGASVLDQLDDVLAKLGIEV